MTGRDPATYHEPAVGKPVVVLAATLIAGAWVWESAIRRLCERGYGCLAFNDPCAGEHDSIESLVVELFASMDKHGIHDAHLVGASFGSIVAMESAIARPHRILSLLISGAPTLNRPDLGVASTGKITLPNAFQIAGKLVADRATIGASRIEETFRYFARRRRLLNLTRLLRASEQYDAAASLPRIECDVLMVWGENDRISRCEDWQRFAPLARRGSLVLIANCGHSPMIEKPDEFDAALLAHLEASTAVSVHKSA